MRTYLTDIWLGFNKLKWFVASIPVLFILRPLSQVIVPDITLPQFIDTHPEYTYSVAIFFIITALIELNIVYLIYKYHENTFTHLLCWIGLGHFIDKFTQAAIKWSISECVWILISILYVYYIWKRRQK